MRDPQVIICCADGRRWDELSVDEQSAFCLSAEKQLNAAIAALLAAEKTTLIPLLQKSSAVSCSSNKSAAADPTDRSRRKTDNTYGDV